MGTRGRKSAAQLAIAPQVVEINRPSGLNVGSPSHFRRSAGMRRRSVHDPTRTFGRFWRDASVDVRDRLLSV